MFNFRNIFGRNLGGIVKKGDNSIKIVYEDGNVRNKFLSWCKYFKIEDISDLFIKLGFNINDVLYLYENYGNLSEVIYSVNENKINNLNTIGFDYKNKEITVSNTCGYKIYSVNYNDNGYKLDLCCRKRIVNESTTCFRTFKNNLFVVDNGNYELIFEVYADSLITKDEFDDLEEYLVSLEFPINIEDVYNKICDLLSLEQSLMKMFSLSVTKNVGKKKVDLVLDNILIQNGNLTKFIKTSGDKRITVDMNGNYYYENLNDNLVIAIKENNDYQFSFKNDDSGKYFTVDDFEHYANVATSDVNSVKKLTKNMFNR